MNIKVIGRSPRKLNGLDTVEGITWPTFGTTAELSDTCPNLLVVYVHLGPLILQLAIVSGGHR